MTKITFISAGSLGFTGILVRDILTLRSSPSKVLWQAILSRSLMTL